MLNRKAFASLMLVLATLLWGLSYSVQSVSAESLGPFATVFFKGAGGLFLLPFLILQKRKADKESVFGGILMGFFAFAGCVFQQLGITYSSVSKASFITSLYIIFVPLLERLLGKEVKKKIWFCVLISICGLYFLCMNSSAGINIGDLFLLMGSIMFAVQIIVIDRYSRKCDALVLTFVSQVSVAVFAFIVMVVWEGVDFSAMSNAFLPIIYIVFIGGLLAQCLQITYQRDLDSSLASLLMSFESVFGAFFGWVLLGQVMSLRELFGCILVFVSILLAEL